ncbi:MAG: sodium:solute symporter family protein [candidate division Zixibacteria bacterium]|nr:sodium:solute symporter family protein [candidate division Zixibacteria bacterium]
MEIVGQILIYLFLLSMLLIGLYHSRKATLDSYTAESNKISSFSLISTLVGTSFGGGVIVGMVTMGYEAGVVGHIVGLSYLIGFIVLALMARRIKDALNEIDGTLLDYINYKYGFSLARITAIVFSLVLFLFLSAQFVAFASFLSFFFSVGFEIAIVLGALFLILYTTIGGFKSVIITDFFQFILLIITSVLILSPIFDGKTIQLLSSLPSEYLNGTGYGIVFLIGAALFLWPTLLARPDIWQRIRAAKNVKTARISLVMSGIIIFAVFSLFSTVGMVARASLTKYNAETVVFSFINDTLPVYGVYICFLAIIAAVMSSADSILNVLAQTSYDSIFRDKKIRQNQDSQRLKALRVTTFFVGIIAVIIAFVFPNIVDLNIGGISTLLVFVMPILAALFAWRTSKKWVSISIIAGTVVIVVLFPLYPKMAFVPGLLISLLIFLLAKTVHNRGQYDSR